jgi:hypothetical protein
VHQREENGRKMPTTKAAWKVSRNIFCCKEIAPKNVRL